MDRGVVAGKSFAPLTTCRPQRARRVLTHAKPSKGSVKRDSVRDVSIGIASILVSRPAWAEQAITELSQKATQLPSSLPSPDEVNRLKESVLVKALPKHLFFVYIYRSCSWMGVKWHQAIFMSNYLLPQDIFVISFSFTMDLGSPQKSITVVL